jgi:hypothetical protein
MGSGGASGARRRTGLNVELDDLLSGLSPSRGPRTASWYGNGRRLVAVSSRGYGERSLQLLAYALQRFDGRELHLVVPRAAVNPMRARAAFVEATLYVHASQRSAVGDAEPPMSRPEAIAFYRRLGGVMPEPDYDVSAWPTWLIELVDWLESRRVERVRTTETYAWHYRGRQVFAVRPAAAGTYTLTAGASFTASETDRTPALTLRVANASPPSGEELQRIKDAVDTAIERRRTAKDQGHREHLLQAAIGTDPSLIGMSHLRRELPARRPKQAPRRGRAYIDFLARDVDRTGHIVETKIGPDAQLGVQALDYWAWAEAHRSRLADAIDADPDRAFELDIVLGLSAEPALHPAAAATLQLLQGPSWRCHLVDEWDTIAYPGRLLTPHAEPLPRGELPTGPWVGAGEGVDL